MKFFFILFFMSCIAFTGYTQNVEKVVPEAVNEIDGYKGVDYARLVPLLIESIRELKKEIEELKLRQR
jgi:hypothetical protein